MRSKNGFTLIEVLLVVAAIAILAGIVIVAINPADTMAKMRNSDRVSAINQIYKGLYQHSIDNKGALDSSVLALDDDTPYDICKNGGSTNCFDAETLLVPQYMAALPEDPNVNTDDDLSGYQIVKTAAGKIVIQASTDYAELGEQFAVGGDFVSGS